MRDRLNKADYDFLDKVGVGQISIEDMDVETQLYLRQCINRAVSIIPFRSVEGAEIYWDENHPENQ